GRLDRTASIRPSIDVALTKADLHWKFPEAANIEDIDKLAELIAKGLQKVLSATETPAQLEKPSSTDDEKGLPCLGFIASRIDVRIRKRRPRECLAGWIAGSLHEGGILRSLKSHRRQRSRS